MSKSFHLFRHGLLLAILFFGLLGSGQNSMAQEIPNGDNDLLWERSIYPRFVNDAKFHPINGNIIAPVNHEIWELDPSDGHTIRIFEGGPDSGPFDQFECVQISSDGNFLVTNEGSGVHGIIIWDYKTGKIQNNFDNGENLAYFATEGIYPDNDRIAYFSYTMNEQGTYVVGSINIYSISQNKIIKYVKTPNQSADIMTLSKDGKYLAIGFRNSYSGQVDNFTMELWDAETLTKIRDFGEAKINEFKDIQISNNSKYIGFLGNIGFDLKLFSIEGSIINLSPFYQVSGFGFSNNGEKTIIDGSINGTYQSIVINNPIDKPHFSFTKMLNIIRFSSSEEIFTAGISMRLFSNNWFTVGVLPQFETKTAISYENDEIIFKFEDNVLLKSFYITDSLGRKVFEQNNLDVQHDRVFHHKINLLPGLYFVTIITDNGQEAAQKLIVNK